MVRFKEESTDYCNTTLNVIFNCKAEDCFLEALTATAMV